MELFFKFKVLEYILGYAVLGIGLIIFISVLINEKIKEYKAKKKREKEQFENNVIYKLHSKVIQKDIYDSYEPAPYKRRTEDDGLLNHLE